MTNPYELRIGTGRIAVTSIAYRNARMLQAFAAGWDEATEDMERDASIAHAARYVDMIISGQIR